MSKSKKSRRAMSPRAWILVTWEGKGERGFARYNNWPEEQTKADKFAKEQIAAGYEVWVYGANALSHHGTEANLPPLPK